MELLVVVVIIVLLMSIALPAVTAARESARRSACSVNQQKIVLALIQADSRDGFLPGWRNPILAAPPDIAATRNLNAVKSPGWPVSILRFMERVDLYTRWSTGNRFAPNEDNSPTPSDFSTFPSTAWPKQYLSVYVCPSRPPTIIESVTAYAGNCGTGSNDRLADGVMADSYNPADQAKNFPYYATRRQVRVSLDDVRSRDGTTTTLLLTERSSQRFRMVYWQRAMGEPRLNAFRFADGSPPGHANYWASDAAANMYMAPPAFGIADASAPPASVIYSTAGVGTPLPYQPSSNHHGGVVAAFCDGRVGFLRDSLAPGVYAQLLTSDGLNASAFIQNDWAQVADVKDADLRP